MFLTPQSRYALDFYPGCLMILDHDGDALFYAPILNNVDSPYVNTRPFDFKVHANGWMSYAPKEGPNYSFYIMDSTFQVIDTITCGNIDTDEHDLVITEDGHYHLICKGYSIADASGLTTANGQPGSPNVSLVSNYVIELDENKNQINSWYALDHIPIEDVWNDFYVDYNYLDHVHTNSIDFDLDSNYVISNRNTCEVTKIDRQTGQVMWRLGGKGNQFQLIGDTIFFNAQHHARIAPNGNLYLFDNARFDTQMISRYLEYELDTVAMTATRVREIQHPTGLNTAIMGNTQLMDNGNVIITWGGFLTDTYPANVSEYDANNNIVMEVDFPYDCISYRVHKQEVPFTLERPEITCDDQTATLSAPAGHSTYEWSTGDTTQSITVTSTGTYYVWVDHGIGFLRSNNVVVDQVDDLCLALSGIEPVEEQIGLFPNPSQDMVTINVPRDLAGNWMLEIFDPAGRLIIKQEFRGQRLAEISLGERPSGIYLFRASNDEKSYSGRVLKP